MPDAPHPWSPLRYLIAVLAVMALVLAATVLATTVVDPYGLNGRFVIDGVNRLKPESHRHALAAKLARAQRHGATTVLLGNSRIDVGFDPADPGWPEDARPVFNLGVPGQGHVMNVMTYFTMVERGLVPRTVVIAMDFFDFLTVPEDIEPPEKRRSDLRLWLETHLSLSAVSDAFATVGQQGDPFVNAMREDGFNPLASMERDLERDGHATIAAFKNSENLRRFAREGAVLAACPATWHWDFPFLARLIEDAGARGIAVVVLTYPYHADTLEGLRAAGLEPALQAWRRDLVGLVDRMRPASGGTPLALYDFMAYDPWTTEPIPAAGDGGARMTYYWEPGHFKAALGSALVRRMMLQDADAPGRALDGAGLPAWQAALAQAAERYRATRAADVARVQALWDRVRAADDAAVACPP